MIEEKGRAGLSLREVARAAGVFRDRDTMELAVTTWSGIHGLAQLISGGYLTRLAATEPQVETLGKMVCPHILTGILNLDKA